MELHWETDKWHSHIRRLDIWSPRFAHISGIAFVFSCFWRGESFFFRDQIFGCQISGLIKRKPSCPSLLNVVLIHGFSDALKERASKEGIHVYSLVDVEERGKACEKREFQPPTPDDICTISYTSGTTGVPKGVIISHANTASVMQGLRFICNTDFSPSDTMASFLPLAHVLEHDMELAAFVSGTRVGYYSGNIKNLPDDLKELRPTIITVVPRLLNRLYDKVMGEVKKSFIKRCIFNMALTLKLREVRSGVIRKDTMFDEYLFAKIRDVFGGRIKVMVVGGAPIAAPVMDFTRATIGAYVISGYGQTESSGLCSLTIECDSDPTVIGSPVHCNYVKLFPVPDLGYDDPEKQGGEICIKGPNVFKGYYKNETITKEVLGEDGWLHTGDIGKWTKSGTIQIIDRVKNIFKLSQGEYIAPEKVENFYAGSKLVSQVFVYGESLKTCLIAIVVPDEEELPRVVEEKLHLKNIPFKDLCSNSLVRKMVMEDMIEVGKESGLFPFEQVKDIFLSDEPFSTENQLLTPTMKNRRGLLKKRYEKELQEMYAKLP